MFNTIKKRIKNEKGLSLVELLAVIVILAIVAAIAIPAIGNIIENSRIKAAKADVANVLSGANIYFTDVIDADGTATVAELEPYVESWGVLNGKTVTVTKAASGNTLSVTETVAVGNKTVTISGATIGNIDVNSNLSTTTFSFK